MSNSRLPRTIQPYPLIPGRQSDDLQRKPDVRHRPISRLFQGSRLRRFLCALRWVSGSLFPCIRILLAKKYWGVDLGPAYCSLLSGCLVANERTDARSDGIQKLRSHYPWANTVLLDVYLEGFDAGERFASRKMDTSETVVCCSPVASHFHSCPDNPKRDLDFDMLKRLWYKSQYESPRHSDPSQSD